MRYKRCGVCAQEFPATNEFFHVRKASNDGLNHKCKPCGRLKTLEYVRKNPERKAANDARYQTENRHRVNKLKREWANNNYTKVAAQKRASAARRREVQRTTKNVSYRARYAADEAFKLNELISGRIRVSLKSDGASKRRRRWESLVGYSLNDLRRHIERQFRDGMSWDRYLSGDIHIDHIRPVASFNLANSDDFAECWALTNLRPLWAADNLSKGSQRLFLL